MGDPGFEEGEGYTMPKAIDGEVVGQSSYFASK